MLELTFEDGIFVLRGVEFGVNDEIPRAAKFRWRSEERYWWTDWTSKANSLIEYADEECRAALLGESTPSAPMTRTAPAPAAVKAQPSGPVVGSEQQEAFWNAVTGTDAHIVLRARAGTGKTFSVCHAASLLGHGKRIGFSAFNKSIADELSARVPSNTSSFTLHSLGYSAVKAAHPGINITIDRDGIYIEDFIKKSLAAERITEDRTFASSVKKLVSLCKNYLLNGKRDDIEYLLRRHDVSLEPSKSVRKRWEKEAPTNQGAAGVLEYIASQERAYNERIYRFVPMVLNYCAGHLDDPTALKQIDYDDMIWMPVVNGYRPSECDLLFVDEAQDMNKSQQELAMAACPNGRIVVVGDDLQSIYGFRGADLRSIDNMKDILANSSRDVLEFPLNETRRCPKLHVADVWGLVPDLKAMDDALEGKIAHIRIEQVATEAQAGDMIICRTNAPLMGVAYSLVRVGKKPVMKSDLAKRLNGFIAAREAFTVPELCEKVASYRIVESANLAAAGKSAQMISNVQDLCDMVLVLAEGCEQIYEIEEKIRKIFSCRDEENGVFLSTVHGAKGLEAECVFILHPELMPHPAAKSDEDLQQERNIEYVAKTRSKHLIVYAYDKGDIPNAEAYMRRLREKAGLPEPSDIPKLPPIEEIIEAENNALLSGDIPAHVLNPAPYQEQFDALEDESLAASDAESEMLALPLPWDEEVAQLINQAREKTPFDQPEVLDALYRALEVLHESQRKVVA